MRKFKGMFAVALAVAVFAALFCGCSSETDEDVLVVGMEVSSDGVFESRDANGDPWGMSVQLANDFGEYLGREVRIENVAWDGLIPALETGKIDVIISSMTITDERAERVDFSEPYALAYLAVLAAKDSGVESVEDLDSPDRTVAVTTGSTGYTYAREHLPEATILALADSGACITEVIQGKADGFIRDQLSVYRASQQNPDTTVAILIPIQDAEPWGAAFAKGNTELRDQFNVFLEEYEADGGYDRLTEDYMAEYKVAFDELGFKCFFDFEN